MFASRGEATPPCGVPVSVWLTSPSSITPAFSHLRIRRMTRRSPTRCSTKRINHSWLTASKNPAMSASNTQFTLVLPIPTASVQCIMRTASGPEPVREPEEIFLVDRVQHLDHRTLDDLVLQRCDAERAAAAIRLWYVMPAR